MVMKKLSMLIAGLLLTGALVAQVQSQTGASVNSGEIKSALAQKTTYHPGAGNALTASITGQLTPALQMNADQQQKMNDALNDYFTAKAPYVQQRRTDPAAYSQHQAALFAQLQTTLSGFLSASQLSRFGAAKPAAGSMNVLKLVYY